MVWQNKLYSNKLRLLSSLGFILVINLAAASILGFQIYRNNLKQFLIKENLPSETQLLYQEIELEIQPALLLSEQLANNLLVRQWLEQGEPNPIFFSRYLEQTRNSIGASSCFLVSETSGTYYNMNGGFSITPDDPEASWYYSFLDSGASYSLNNTINTDLNNTPTLFINRRMEDEQGNILGVAGIGMALESIQKLLDFFEGDETRHIYFVNDNGDVLLKSDPAGFSQGGVTLSETVRTHLDQVQTGEIDSFEYVFDGQNFITATRFVPTIRWWIVIVQSEADFLAIISRILSTQLWLEGSAILFTLLLVFLTVNFYQKKLEKMATIDALTGIPNRFIFKITLQQALLRQKRSGETFSIILFDIDFFKKVNDSCGHLAGDRILKEISCITGEQMRESDHFSRWGGEEFAILLNNCNLKQAFLVAEKLRIAIESASLLTESDPLTISLGVTESQKEDTQDKIFARVDEALYQAKKNGRNCVSS